MATEQILPPPSSASLPTAHLASSRTHYRGPACGRQIVLGVDTLWHSIADAPMNTVWCEECVAFARDLPTPGCAPRVRRGTLLLVILIVLGVWLVTCDPAIVEVWM